MRITNHNDLLKPEGFEISNQDQTITIEAIDGSGLSYGALWLSEHLRIQPELQKITSQLKNPSFKVRGIKFIPWDAYRGSKSMDLHPDTCRDLQFWEAFLDMMQKSRFNLLALYNMHPFHYMVKLENYPEANTFTGPLIIMRSPILKQLILVTVPTNFRISICSAGKSY